MRLTPVALFLEFHPHSIAICLNVKQESFEIIAKRLIDVPHGQFLRCVECLRKGSHRLDEGADIGGAIVIMVGTFH